MPATKRTTQDRFDEFHAANPLVWEQFKVYADQLFAATNRISPNFIVDRIRWEAAITTTPTRGSGFHVAAKKSLKINDHFASRYARLYVREFPMLERFVEMREIRTP